MEQAHHWHKLEKRLEQVIDSKLKLTFHNAPVRKKTQWSEILLPFFYVKLNDEIIWRFPNDVPMKNKEIMQESIYEGKENHPISILIRYLNTPKESLLDFEDSTGFADLLKVADKRIGFERLKKMIFSDSSYLIFKTRFDKKIESYNPIVFTEYRVLIDETDDIIWGAMDLYAKRDLDLPCSLIIHANTSENKTLLPMLQFQNTAEVTEQISMKDLCIISVEQEPQILEKCFENKIGEERLIQLKNWIIKNLYSLQAYWNLKIGAFEFCKKIEEKNNKMEK